MEEDFVCDESQAEAIRASENLNDIVVIYNKKIRAYTGLKKPVEGKTQAQIDWEIENSYRIGSDDPNDKYYTSTGEEWEIGEDW